MFNFHHLWDIFVLFKMAMLTPKSSIIQKLRLKFWSKWIIDKSVPVVLFFSINFVSSISVSQKRIFSPAEHLRWRFFAKMVSSKNLLTIFAKKLHCRCLTGFKIHLCKQPLKSVVKWKAKTWEIFRATFIHWFLIYWDTIIFSDTQL